MAQRGLDYRLRQSPPPLREAAVERVFSQLIDNSRRIDRDDFARSFGDVATDVAQMVTSPTADDVTAEVRRRMESAPSLPWGAPRLRQVEFGRFDDAPELASGIVAAVDGRPILPIQSYTAGQALCVGVGSLSHLRRDMDSLHYWSSHVALEAVRTVEEFLARQHEGLFGISQTAYMRYHEVRHALDIQEDIVLLDGTLVYQWLLATPEGLALYHELFASGKRCLGVMKSLRENAWFSLMARAIKRGEVYVAQTLQEHLTKGKGPEKNHGEGAAAYTDNAFYNEVAPKIWRGIFRPRDKVFGFEVHERDLETLLPIMAADCQMNHVGHEIPYLLNRVDEQVRHHFRSGPLGIHLQSELSSLGEEVAFREFHELDYR